MSANIIERAYNMMSIRLSVHNTNMVHRRARVQNHNVTPLSCSGMSPKTHWAGPDRPRPPLTRATEVHGEYLYEALNVSVGTAEACMCL